MGKVIINLERLRHITLEGGGILVREGLTDLLGAANEEVDPTPMAALSASVACCWLL